MHIPQSHTCSCWRLALSISVMMMPFQLIGQLLSKRCVSFWCARPLVVHPQIQRSLSCRDKIKQTLRNSCSLFTSQLYSWSAFNKTQGCIIMSITESKLMLRNKHSAYQKRSVQYSYSRTQLSFIWYECTFSSTTASQRTRRNSPGTVNAAWSTLIASCIERIHLLHTAH